MARDAPQAFAGLQSPGLFGVAHTTAMLFLNTRPAQCELKSRLGGVGWH
jgi:hypothetical protein